MKKILFFSLLMGAFILTLSQGWAQPKLATRGPVITAYYAADHGGYGYPLKIYIEANDPESDMLRVATVAFQWGYGRYPTDWVYLKPQDGGRFRGYLQWNTWSNHTAYMPEWTRVILTISVLDKAGNESNVVVVPYEFVTGLPVSNPPAPFNQGDVPRLGYLDINLFNPFNMGK